MDSNTIWIAELALFAGTMSVVFALVLIRFWDRARGGLSGKRRVDQDPRHLPTVFLFRSNKLIDATPPAHSLLRHRCSQGNEWQSLQSWIASRFPEAIEKIDHPDRPSRMETVGSISSDGPKIRLLVEDLGRDLMRITLSDMQPEQTGINVDALSHQAMVDELELLQHALDNTPTMIWRQDARDRVTWANAAYLERAEMVAPLGWPLPRLLDVSIDQTETESVFSRAKLQVDGQTYWYDCYIHQYGEERIFFALPADAAVQAERILREFVQTLTKTFAALHVGLAIFDRQRNLQLFNPALLELTGLPVEFVAARPKLADFLDQLRERRMVPEPRDYRSWREHISNLEAAAARGHHVEEWSLPDGQTIRVTGCPHPDGAVAFLFDDISSEISMTRKFRAELGLCRAVLDGQDDALAVFAADGKLVLSNRAYRDLWGDGAATMVDCIEEWRHLIRVGPGFDSLCNRLLTSGGQALRSDGAMAGPEGCLIGWSVSSIGGGKRMLRFRRDEVGAPALPKEAEKELPNAIGNYR